MERQVLISPGEEERVITLDLLEGEDMVKSFEADLVDDSRIISRLIEMWMNGDDAEYVERIAEEMWA